MIDINSQRFNISLTGFFYFIISILFRNKFQSVFDNLLELACCCNASTFF